ncbi:MAG: hypothetical protein AB8B57_06200 [Congregibacter sp.]
MRAIMLFVCLFPAIGFAQSLGMESDWLELVKGHHENKMGIDVMDVTTDPETGEQMIKLSIPKESMAESTRDSDDMEEVRVIGRAPDKAEPIDLFPELETQWIDDYDNGHYGLLVKFKKRQAIPFRLFMSSGDGFLDNSVKP